MASLLMDKLLQTVINQDASDLHITVGQPPVLRVHGRMRRLETKELEADDTVSLMKQIAPERCQQQLQEVGGADFGFAFGEQARFASLCSNSAATSPWCCGSFPRRL